MSLSPRRAPPVEDSPTCEPCAGRTAASLHRCALRIASATLLSWAVFLPAVASAQSRIPTHVACVGDSITAGVGASSPATDFPSDLQKLLGASAQVQNFGHSGATLLSTGNLPYVQQPEYGRATTFVANAGANAVVDVVIMLGTNDSKPFNWTTADGGTSAAQFQSDYAAMVSHFANLSTRPVVYLVFPPAAYANGFQISGTVIHDAIIPVIAKVAMQKGAPVIDVNTPTLGKPQLFVDGVHPNDTGYALVAQLVHDALLRPLAGDAGLVEAGSPAGWPESGAGESGTGESGVAEGGVSESGAIESGVGQSGAPSPEGGEPDTGGSLPDSSASGGNAVDSTGGDAGMDGASSTSPSSPAASPTPPNQPGGCTLVASCAGWAAPFAAIAVFAVWLAARRRRR